MKEGTTTNENEITEMNKTIKKKILFGTRTYKNRQINETLEEERSLEVL